MQILTDLTWNYMQSKLDNVLSKNDTFIILDWILLPNCKYWDKCNYKILITSNDIARKNKVIDRDNISVDYFEKRDSASIDYSTFKFDYIFENNYNMQNLYIAIDDFITLLKKT